MLTQKAIAQVGTISANSDKEIGDIIAEAMGEGRNSGVITVEEGQSLENEPDSCRRHAVSTVVTYHRISSTTLQKGAVELDNLLSLLVDKKVSSIRELLPTSESRF